MGKRKQIFPQKANAGAYPYPGSIFEGRAFFSFVDKNVKIIWFSCFRGALVLNAPLRLSYGLGQKRRFMNLYFSDDVTKLSAIEQTQVPIPVKIFGSKSVIVVIEIIKTRVFVKRLLPSFNVLAI